MTTTETSTATRAATTAESPVEAAERRVHAAECWLHTTRQSGVAEWISGAAAILHEAIQEYLRLGGTWSQAS